jgi:hypothetical protein
MNAGKKNLLTAALAASWLLALTACNTTNSSGGFKETEIITDPAGARIEINGDYIGNSPIKYTFNQSPVGTILGNYLIRATPIDPKQQPQTRRLEGPYVPLTGPVDKVPEKLFFDLRRPPPDLDGL